MLSGCGGGYPRPPVADAGGPYSGQVGQTITFNGVASKPPGGQTIIAYVWNFGDGSSGSGVSPTHIYAKAGNYQVSLTVADAGQDTGTATATATIAAQPGPAISSFSPVSGPIGTVVTVSGSNFIQYHGPAPEILMAQIGGGSLPAPLSNFTANTVSFVIPPGAASGPFEVSIGSENATSATPFTVTTSTSFTVGVAPTPASLIQGQSIALAVTLNSPNGFSGLASLAVFGLPAGITASFIPSAIALGQTSVLTLKAAATQSTGSSNFSVSATALIDGQSITQFAAGSVNVTGITTSFNGRTVVDDATETPISGVTVSFAGQDGSRRNTGCSGTTVSDAGGNFALTGLPTACTGPQLIFYNGATATSPAGKYAGVTLKYTLAANRVTTSPVLVHLPRIDNAETVQVQQNAPNDQVFYFHSIPELNVTVYKGTTFALDDGSQPNPFPLVAIEIPIDRLPDAIPTSGMLNPFIVAFQPANATASQPVSVDFPNALNTPPGTIATFVTLDPTRGVMVPYGTGTVSKDGNQFVANADPAHAGHGYGLVHFDWHGPTVPQPPIVNPGPPSSPPCYTCPCPDAEPPTAGKPVDLSSGIVFYDSTDLQISGGRGSVAINRYYRTLAPYQGPFGIGTSTSYSYSLNTLAYVNGGATITLAMPDGNQFLMSQTLNGTFVNTTIPSLRSAALTANGTSGPYTLRWADGTQYQFTVFANLGAAGAFLTSITDLNGNTTTISVNPNTPQQILAITDPVGRSMTLTYDGSSRVTQITDPIGRKILYTYNSQGTLATYTDANGGVTSYTYDSANNLATITDPRGLVTEKNTFNESFDGRVTQQIEADGGVHQFAYTLMNPGVATSPVLQTVVTDPLGYQTTYRFNSLGLLVSATDPKGQTRTLTRDPSHNNLVSAYTGAGLCQVGGDPAAGSVTFTFDEFGNALTQTDARGNTTTFTYDTRFNKVSAVTDPLNHTTAITYDSNGNALAITDANGNASQYSYDAFGDLIQTIDPTGSKTAVAFDGYGNVSSVSDALANTSKLSFDGVSRLIRSIDALGRNSTTTYDALDRITSQTDPRGATSSFTYDPIGNLLNFKDARGNVTQFGYDSMSRLQSRTSSLGKSEKYIYDMDSNLTQYTDRRGQVSTYTYDILNRLEQENYPDATVMRGYDANNRLISVTDSAGGDVGLGYDAAGRLLSQQEPTGVVNYTLDPAGRVVTRQVAGQPAVQYTYDPAGNMLSAAFPNAGLSFTYDPRNLPQMLTRTNGVVTNYTYDALGRVLSIIHALGGAPLNTQNYTYDAVGNRSLVSNDISQPLITQSATATVDSGNELLSNAGTTYTYDANDNRITETSASGTVTYTWDGRNRLSSIKDASGNITAMQYDFGRNLLGVSRSDSGASAAKQDFVVDALTNVVSLTDSSGAPVSVLTGQSIDSHLASLDAAGNVLFGIGDASGSTTAITNGTGDIAEKFAYEPYGRTTGSTEIAYPFAYTGRVPILGNIYYFRNRFYDTGTGRFISEDPSGADDGSVLYAYAANNPIAFNDPLGLQEVSPVRSPSYPICIYIPPFIPRGGGGGTADPGDCSEGQKKSLQNQVNMQCKPKPKQCHAGDSCLSLKQRASQFAACAAARKKINDACYEGGNLTHRAEASSAANQAAICEFFESICSE